MATTKSPRWFCPHCQRERTGDALDRPCACLRERAERRKKAMMRRLRSGGDAFERAFPEAAIA